MNGKFSIACGLVLIFIIHEVQGDVLNHQCVTFGKKCNQNRPCCEESLKCVWSDSATEYQCINKATLGDNCITNKECTDVLHSTCSVGTCVCRLNTVLFNKTCMPLLNEFCWKESCAPDHSECVNNQCQCKNGFLALGNHQCVPNVLLGGPCNDDADCKAIEFAECSWIKTCVCSKKSMMMSPRLCMLPLGNTCKGNNECRVANSECIDNKCQCMQEYIAAFNTECEDAYLGMPCNDLTYCQSYKADAKCIEKICGCNSNHVPSHANLCLPQYVVQKHCKSNHECKLNNSSCIDNECQFRPEHLLRETKYLPMSLQVFCENDDQCRLIPNSKCSNDNQCICKDNHAQQNIWACAPLLNESCSIKNQCITENSLCINNVCQCRDGHLQRSNNMCVPLYFEKSCVVDTDCIDISNAKCFGGKKCDCPPNFVRSGVLRCSLLREAYCKQDGDCVDKNSTCFDNKCQCPKGYLQASDYLCARVFLGQHCSRDTDCNVIKNGRCSGDNICVCKPGYSSFDQLVCLPLIGQRCNEHKECFVFNSNCIDNKCQCLENYVPMSNTQCLSRYSGIICYVDSDCNVINSRCSRFNRCVCNNKYIFTGKSLCKPILDGGCSETLNCLTANSHCIDNQCQCKTNFARGSHNNCLLTHLGGYCADDNDCAAIKYSQCIGHKCICGKNFVMLNNTTCQSLLNSPCDTFNDCFAENTICLNNKCQCEFSYTERLPHGCEPISLGQPCERDLNCSNIYKGKCSAEKICTCSSDTFALGGMTCSPLLNSRCKYKNCKIKNSHCIDNKCQCKSGYAAVSSTQCINNKCSKEKKCVCKTNNMAVNNSTCLPLLGGTCWKDDQCQTKNSYCSDYYCHCRLNFNPVSNNMCVLSF